MSSLRKSIPPNEQLQHILSDASKYRQNEDGIWLNTDISRNRADRPVINGRTFLFNQKPDIDVYDDRIDGYGYGLISPSSGDSRVLKNATITIKFISAGTSSNFLFGYFGSSFVYFQGNDLWFRTQGTGDTTVTDVVLNSANILNTVTLTCNSLGIWVIYQNGYSIYSRLAYTDGFLFRNVGGRGDGAFYVGNFYMIEYATYGRTWSEEEHAAYHNGNLHDINKSGLRVVLNGDCGGGITVWDGSGNQKHSRLQNLFTVGGIHATRQLFKSVANTRGYNPLTYIEGGSFISTNYTPSLSNIEWKQEFEFYLLHQTTGSNCHYLGNRHDSVASGSWYTLYLSNGSGGDDTHKNVQLGYALAHNYPEYYSASDIPGSYKIGDRVDGWIGQLKGGKIRLVINVNGVNKFDQEFFVDGLSFTRDRVTFNGGRDVSLSPYLAWKYGKFTYAGEVIGEFDFTKPFDIDDYSDNWYLDGNATPPSPYFFPENYNNPGYNILGEKLPLTKPKYNAVFKSPTMAWTNAQDIIAGNQPGLRVDNWIIRTKFYYDNQITATERTICAIQHNTNLQQGLTLRIPDWASWRLTVVYQNTQLGRSPVLEMNKVYDFEISYINGWYRMIMNGELLHDAPYTNVGNGWGNLTTIGSFWNGAAYTKPFSGRIYSLTLDETDVNGNITKNLLELAYLHASDVVHNIAKDAPFDLANQRKRTYDIQDHTNPGHIVNSEYAPPLAQTKKQYLGNVGLVKNAGNIYDGNYWYGGNPGYGIDSAGRFYNWQEMAAYTAIHIRNIPDLEGVKVKFKFNIYRLRYTGDGFRLIKPDATYTLVTSAGYYETEGVMGKSIWRTTFGGLYTNIIWQAGNSVIHDIYFDFDIEIIGPNWRKPKHDGIEAETSIVLNPSGKWQVDGDEELIMNPDNASEFSFNSSDSKSYSDLENYKGVFIREDA